MGAKHLGARVKRLEDPSLLSGRGRFVDDLKVSNALHACFVRSTYAHAKIQSVDGAAALAMPGVYAVITVNDLPEPMRSQPMAMLLLHENATVTICHSKTRNLPAITREADILVAAIGRPGFIEPEMVKLVDPIKECGIFPEVKLSLGYEIEAKIEVAVIPQAMGKK